MKTPRTTLTKSLHTITAISRLAAHLRLTTPGLTDPEAACRGALDVLGYSSDWSLSDPTFYACVIATIRIPLPAHAPSRAAGLAHQSPAV